VGQFHPPTQPSQVHSCCSPRRKMISCYGINPTSQQNFRLIGYSKKTWSGERGYPRFWHAHTLSYILRSYEGVVPVAALLSPQFQQDLQQCLHCYYSLHLPQHLPAHRSGNMLINCFNERKKKTIKIQFIIFFQEAKMTPYFNLRLHWFILISAAKHFVNIWTWFFP
jgi:hypothetical protein